MRRYDVMVGAISDVISPDDLLEFVNLHARRPDLASVAERFLDTGTFNVTVRRPDSEMTTSRSGVIGFTPDDAGRASLVTWSDLATAIGHAATDDRIEAIQETHLNFSERRRGNANALPMRAAIADLAIAAAASEGLSPASPGLADGRDVVLHERSGLTNLMCDGRNMVILEALGDDRVHVRVPADLDRHVGAHETWLYGRTDAPGEPFSLDANADRSEWNVTTGGRPVARLTDRDARSVALEIIDHGTGITERASVTNVNHQSVRSVVAAANRLLQPRAATTVEGGRGR